MLCWFSNQANVGILHLFTHGLFWALSEIDEACPGYSEEMLRRISQIEGIGTDKLQAIIQILAEIYVTQGAVAAADVDEAGRLLFNHEPRSGRGKNPEFETRARAHWYAIEVKAPGLVVHAQERTQRRLQLLTRIAPSKYYNEPATLPRDNPVKDFLISANSKFKQYAVHRPCAFRILTIVWDDAGQEPISALCNSISGLLTENSFYKDKNGRAVTYEFVDGIVIEVTQ